MNLASQQPTRHERASETVSSNTRRYLIQQVARHQFLSPHRLTGSLLMLVQVQQLVGQQAGPQDLALPGTELQGTVGRIPPTPLRETESERRETG